jgi:putative ABC transport system permease protein
VSLWRRLTTGIRTIAARSAADRDIADEVGHFLEEAAAARQSEGLSPAEARRAVRLDVGNAVAIEEQIRESSRPSSIQLCDSIWQDLRHGCRVLCHNRGFSVVALSILAIGIGAATTIFSFVDGVLLKPLPYDHGDRIVRLLERRPDGASSGISTRAYLDWRSNSTIFEEMAAQQQGLVTMTGSTDAVPLRVGRVTARYFDVFGVKASLGRTFADGEDAPGKEHVVVLSHALWQSQFGSDARTVGTTILLDNEPYTVIGVLPPGSAFDRGVAQLWHPLAFRPTNMTWDYRWLTASYVRLKPGVSLEQARAQMDAIGKRIATENPNSNRGWGVVVERYADSIVGPQLRTSLLALIGAVAGLVLICCSNLASLVLVRAVSRKTEVAVRAALGASRRRLLQQLFIEHAALTAGGSVLGIASASAAIGWLNQTVPRGVLPSEASVNLDVRVVAFALGVSAVTGILFGLMPALRGSSPDLAGAMGRRGATPSRARRRLLDALVIGEVAVAFILLCGSALLIRSLVQLIDVETGFVADNVLTMRLPLPGFPPGSRYASPDEFKTYLRSIEASIASIPGVQHTGVTSAVPLTDCCLYSLNMQIANRPVVDRANRGGGFFKVVTPGYFSSLGLTLRKGRFLNGRDIGSAVPVIVVNERLANRYFPSEDPIGQHILNPGIVPGRTERGPDISWEIVGVVANEKIGALSDDNSAVVYASYEQSPVYFANLVVRSVLGPGALEKAVRSTLFDLNKSQAVLDVRTLEQLKSASVASSRVQAALMSTFSVVAIALAAIGMYGVLAYSVVLRRREIGIRAALGASSSVLLRAVLGQGLFVTLLGLTIGMVGAFALAPLLGSVLYNVQARDPFLMTLATTILVIVGLLASVIPARRAANVDPIVVLRGD